MSKKKRVRKTTKIIMLLVEGDTEENYIKGVKTFYPDIEFNIVPVNMRGGGYQTYIDEIRKMSLIGCLGVFIIIDIDRAKESQHELKKLKELFELCRSKSSKEVPILIIGNNSDIEYFACCHCPSYTGGNTDNYIRNVFGKDVNKFKSDSKIYEFLNKGGRDWKNAITYNSRKYTTNQTVFKNIYKVMKKGLSIDINLKDSNLNLNNLNIPGTNFCEFFDIIGLL